MALGWLLNLGFAGSGDAGGAVFVPVSQLVQGLNGMAIYNQALTVNFLAWDTSANAGKTGDSANFTLRLIKDGGVAAAPGGAISEPDSTNLPGVYEIALTATEMQANFVTLGGISSTGNVVIFPLTITTERGDLATIDTVVDGIQTDLDNGTDGLGAIKADTAAILVDTADIQPNYATAAELAKVPKSDGVVSWNATALAAINAEADTAISDASLATAAALATVDSNVDAILIDTGTTLDGKINTIDTVVDAILVDTDATIPGLIAALNDISVADILTTQMTESYNADGSAPTLAQALHLIIANLFERSVSGTTVTFKQLDGTTTAATGTLDDGTNPTSITRAT